MSIILRVDVDKPYGKHTFTRKLASKLKEDYFPTLNLHFDYLSHLKEMIKYCNNEGIRGMFYHRLCTVPDEETIKLFEIGGHQWGLHLENSRSIDTFTQEWLIFRNYSGCKNAKSFSKHGSGFHKLGKHHYEIYEPKTYQNWAKKMGYEYPSGNGIASCAEDLFADSNGWFPNLFWLEADYRLPKFSSVEDMINSAKDNLVVVLIHPCNYIADSRTRNDFHLMVKLAKQFNIGVNSFQNK